MTWPKQTYKVLSEVLTAQVTAFFWVVTTRKLVEIPNPEEGHSMSLRYVSIYRSVYTATQPRRSLSLLQVPKALVPSGPGVNTRAHKRNV